MIYLPGTYNKVEEFLYRDIKPSPIFDETQNDQFHESSDATTEASQHHFEGRFFINRHTRLTSVF